MFEMAITPYHASASFTSPLLANLSAIDPSPYATSVTYEIIQHRLKNTTILLEKLYAPKLISISVKNLIGFEHSSGSFHTNSFLDYFIKKFFSSPQHYIKAENLFLLKPYQLSTAHQQWEKIQAKTSTFLESDCLNNFGIKTKNEENYFNDKKIYKTYYGNDSFQKLSTDNKSIPFYFDHEQNSWVINVDKINGLTSRQLLESAAPFLRALFHDKTSGSHQLETFIENFIDTSAGESQTSTEPVASITYSNTQEVEISKMASKKVRVSRPILSFEDNLLRLNTHSTDSLGKIENYKGSVANTRAVGQGEAHFLSIKNKQVDGLYTHGSLTCLILVAVVKDNLGSPSKIALAHIDDSAQEAVLDQFFKQLSNLRKIEVSLLAGHEGVAIRALNSIDRAGAELVFASMSSQVSAAAVDKSGNIYFGNNPKLNEIDASPEKFQQAWNRLVTISNQEKPKLADQLSFKFHTEK